MFYTRVPTHAVGISPSVHSPPTAATTAVATLATSGAIAADAVVVVSASHLLDVVAPSGCPERETCTAEGVQDISMGAYMFQRHTSRFLTHCIFLVDWLGSVGIWTRQWIDQNPDEPAVKPTLQSFNIDLNQTGPMVQFPSVLSFPLKADSPTMHAHVRDARSSMPSSRLRTKSTRR